MKPFLSFLTLLITTLAFSQPASLPEEVKASITKRIEYGLTPSVAVGIVDKNGVHYYNFGKTRANGSAVDEHSIYEIGSISKVFTAILLSQAVLDGKMRLDDPVRKYLPQEVKMPQRGPNEITLGNLSDHTSGLPGMPNNFDPKDPTNPYADYTVEQLFAFLSGYELTREPGDSYEYSNLAQGLLGQILSRQAGTTYEDLMIRTIATPLKMKETKITFDANMKSHLAIGHSGGREVSNWDIPTLAGAGAIRSSTSDMLKFLSANLGLTPSPLFHAMNLSQQTRHAKAGRNRVALGWHIIKGKNGDVIWHNGGTGGYRTFAGFVRETQTGVVVLTNSSAGADDIGFHLLNPDAPLNDVKASVGMEMKKAIAASGIDVGIAKYYELKKSAPTQYDFSEDALNELGYSYMDTNLPAALAVLKLNTELFPASANVYDSYGEALAKNNQKDAAIENYKKSVDINPGNTSAIVALGKLGVTYKPAVVEVPEAVLETYVGSYELSPGFLIVVTRKGTQLFAQATGQNQFELFAKSNTEFYLKVVPAQITFNVTDGAVQSITLHQNGRDVPGKRVK